MSEGISNGAATIPAAGSQPARLSFPTPISSVLVYFSSTNTDPVYVGGSSVTTSTGVPFAAGAYLTVDIGDTGSIYLAGTENDTVRWFAVGRGVVPD